MEADLQEADDLINLYLDFLADTPVFTGFESDVGAVCKYCFSGNEIEICFTSALQVTTVVGLGTDSAF